jgi:Zn-dependent M28 family amino/carboxypeptidase
MPLSLRSLLLVSVCSTVFAPASAATPDAGPSPAGTRAAAGGTAVVAPAERRAAASIAPSLLRAHIRVLADDLFEGRGPATRGDQLTQLYVRTQFEAAGLEPGAPDGSWLQPVQLVGVTSRTEGNARVTRGSAGFDLATGTELVAFAGRPVDHARVADAEIVFVGYGMVAPEYGWDDYKGTDLRGKVLLMLNNDPQDDPKLFAGKTRLYYGRWDYKYEQAARVGAAAAIIVHTTPSAGYPWQVVQTSWTGELFQLPDEGPQVDIKAWATEDASRRLVALGGHDLDTLRQAAERREFRPVPLGVTWTAALSAQVRRTSSANVLARLPGSDPALAGEVVLISAHHDHLGQHAAAETGQDVIYNGAVDNASGVAALLAIARAAALLETRPRRTLLFAALAAEEQGLLGSRHLARNLPVKPGRVAANVNIDGLNVLGRTRDLNVIGLGKSNVDDYVQALARLQGRVVLPDQFPDRGFFYRSDQFSFAKQGIPAAYFHAGTDVIGRPAGYGRSRREQFEAHDYHQPSDQFDETWDLAGAVEDTQLAFHLALKLANAARKPAWRPGDEFEAARKAALREIGE